MKITPSRRMDWGIQGRGYRWKYTYNDSFGSRRVLAFVLRLFISSYYIDKIDSLSNFIRFLSSVRFSKSKIVKQKESKSIVTFAPKLSQFSREPKILDPYWNFHVFLVKNPIVDKSSRRELYKIEISRTRVLGRAQRREELRNNRRELSSRTGDEVE